MCYHHVFLQLFLLYMHAVYSRKYFTCLHVERTFGLIKKKKEKRTTALNLGLKTIPHSDCLQTVCILHGLI